MTDNNYEANVERARDHADALIHLYTHRQLMELMTSNAAAVGDPQHAGQVTLALLDTIDTIQHNDRPWGKGDDVFNRRDAETALSLLRKIAKDDICNEWHVSPNGAVGYIETVVDMKELSSNEIELFERVVNSQP